jgi:putative membrane protein
VNRQAQAVVLFLVGGALLHAGLTDLYLRYVKAGLQPLLLAAGVVLIAAALATVWYELRDRRPAHLAEHDGGHGHGHAHDGGPEDRHETRHETRHDDNHDDGHGHGHREPRVSWLLVLPLLALVLVAPPALGSYSAMRTGTVLTKPYGFPALPRDNPLQLTVIDYADRAVYDHGHSFGGRRIELTGFIALDESGKPYLTRMVLNCCAADAQPVKVALSGRLPPILQPDVWLDVVGTYTGQQTKDPVNDGAIPFIKVSRARTVPTPHDPYESPQ